MRAYATPVHLCCLVLLSARGHAASPADAVVWGKNAQSVRICMTVVLSLLFSCPYPCSRDLRTHLKGYPIDLCFHSTGEKELVAECGLGVGIVSVFVKSRGDFILVGDLLRSVSLLMYSPVNGTLEQIGQDHEGKWTTAIEMLDDEIFIGAENEYNLFTVRKVCGLEGFMSACARGRYAIGGTHIICLP